MFSQLTLWLYPLFGLMACGALLVLGLIVWRAGICPGQRARIMRQSASVWVMTALSAMLAASAQGPGWLVLCGALAAIGGLGLSGWQARLEGKRSIQSRWLLGPGALLGVYALGLIPGLGWGASLSILVVLGAALAHLILLRARHRLSAFNLLLPIAGLAGALLGLLVLGSLAWLQPDQGLLDTLLPWVLGYAGLMLAGLLIWVSPLLAERDNAPPVLSAALGVLLLAECAASRLFLLI